jgi:ribosomal protein S18 acetylase RimI-like enzyme
MVSIRPFEEHDNAALLEIEKFCPQGNIQYAWGADRSPDIIARYKLYDNWKVLVAEDDGKIAGWIGWTIKRGLIKEEPYVYLAEIMVYPHFRRKGIATRLVKEVEKNAHEIGSNYVYCYIFEPNDASRALFRKLGYSHMEDIKSHALSVYKKAEVAQNFVIERINRTDIRDAVSLINNYYAGRPHFMPYTPESLESHINGIPAYGLENFWVVKENSKMVACAGLWDYSILQKMSMARLPFSWKVMRVGFGFLGLFMKMQKIPAEGEIFEPQFLTDHAFELKKSDAMSNLIAYINNILIDRKRDIFVAVQSSNDPIFEITKKSSPSIDTFNLYAKSIEGELPKFSPLYLDIRDAIL